MRVANVGGHYGVERQIALVALQELRPVLLGPHGELAAHGILRFFNVRVDAVVGQGLDAGSVRHGEGSREWWR